MTAPPDLDRVQRAHLIGIGGAAMTPLASILLQSGVRVTGSDLMDADHLRLLRELGAAIWIGHDAERMGRPDVVITSSAVPDEDPEVQAARALGVPILRHAQALGALMRTRAGIAVAGTHGKSTTSAMIAHLLVAAGLDPTYHIGAELITSGRFGQLGRGRHLVAEADEFDRRFLEYEPAIAVVTYVEPDHLDYFGRFEAVVEAFQQFVRRVRPDGLVVLNADDPVASSLAVEGRRRLTYGEAEAADWRVTEWRPAGPSGGCVRLRSPEGAELTFTLGVLGRHNALNAAAAVAVAASLDVPRPAIAAALASFRGVKRRLETVGQAAGVTVVDDYGHHPTEVRASLQAVRTHLLGDGRLWLIYQPHTQHRTASLLAEFAGCFEHADHLIVTPAYLPAGRFLATEGATAEQLVAVVRHPDARALAPPQAIQHVADRARAGDVVVVMGAGDIWTIERPLLARLQAGGRRRSGEANG